MNACKLVGLLLLLLWGHTTLYAQQVRTVRGRVQTVEAGSNEKRALPSASIVILAKSDSAFIKGIRMGVSFLIINRRRKRNTC